MVPEGLVGERVDAGLARLLGLSRTRVVEMVASGGVLVDGAPAGKSDRLPPNGWVDVALPEPDRWPAAVGIVAGLRIVYDDSDLVVVDKPAGVAAHPGPGWTGPTVVGHLAAAGFSLATSGPAERTGVVHRLDAGTSGLMVVAKSEPGYAALKRAFRDRRVDKVYAALVQGRLDPLTGTIDAPVGRHPRHDHRWAVVASGKPSVTHYETLEAHRFASLLRVRLETGRTHQIRVHLSALRHPCVGDLTYGADPTLAERTGLTRQWLHANRLGFEHPRTSSWVDYESPFPDDLARTLDVIREGS